MIKTIEELERVTRELLFLYIKELNKIVRINKKQNNWRI